MIALRVPYLFVIDPGPHSHDVFRVSIVDNFYSNGPSSSKIYRLVVYLIVYETE